MRKLFIPPILLALLLIAAGCGGGSSSSGGSSGSSTSAEAASSGPEAAWAKEVTKVMSHFENHVSAQATENINTTYRQPLLEPLYRSYAIELAKLTDQLEATDAPAACAAVQKQMVDDGRAIAQLTKQLGHQGEKNEGDYAAFAQVQRIKIRRYGGDLTKLSFEPSC